MYNSFSEIELWLQHYYHGGEYPRRFTGEEQAKWIFGLIKETSESAWICEVGTFYGYMTVTMGLASLGSDRQVVAVDHMVGNFCGKPETRAKCFYLDWIKNMKHFEVWGKIVPLPMKSHGCMDPSKYAEDILPAETIDSEYFQAVEMISMMGIKFELIYLDGNHSTENVAKELKLYTKLLKPLGVIAGDDCQIQGRPFVDAFKHSPELFANGVGVAVWQFFKGNNQYEPLEKIPQNQFAFRRLP